MPYYKWQGVDIHAVCHKGWFYADSIQTLTNQLLKKEIALLNAKPVKVWHIKKANLDTKIAVTGRITTLLKAGVTLPMALDLVATNSTDKSVQYVLYETSFLISTGAALHEVIRKYSLFDSSLTGLAEIGASTGNVAYAFEHTYHYLQSRKNLKSSIWSAVHTPLITLMFFLIVSLIMIVFIIPQFAAVYQSFQGSLPTVTQRMILLSGWMKDKDFLIVILSSLGALAIAIVSLFCWARSWIDYLVVSLPGLGEMIRSYYYSFFLLSVGQLLVSGMSLHQALGAAQHVVKNYHLQSNIHALIHAIENGFPLHLAMKNGGKWNTDTIALVSVGYESGSLAGMIMQSSQIYFANLQKRLNRIIVLMQPCLLIMLGLLIGFFVYALYAPIFSLGEIMK